MKKTKPEPIPTLTCTKKPDPKCNNGYYTVSIPLKYILGAYEKPAAFFEFRFIGMRDK